MQRFLILTLLLFVLFASNLFFGAIRIPAIEVWGALTGDLSIPEAIRFIVLESRFPQALTAILCGAGLSAAGLLMQTTFRNPLAGPSILGISSGASLGVAIVTLFLGGGLAAGNVSIGGTSALLIGALIGSFSVMGLLILLSARLHNDLMLLITGILLGYLTSSVVTLLSSLSTAGGIQSFVMWGMGSFGGVSPARLPVFAIATLLGLGLSLLLAKPLNILMLGDNYARNLGINIRRVRNLLLLSSGLLTAIITAYCGPISFIGLAMPHIARIIFRTSDHWILLPGAMLAGGIVCLICNLLSVLPSSTLIPINALTPVVGVPVIIYVILRRR